MNNPGTRTARSCEFALLLAAAAILTVAIYWAGLRGPLLLDDVSSLGPITGWLQGQYDWRYVVFGNQSGPLGRPLSMATFMANAAVMHADAGFAFKPTNVFIHILCGLAMVWLATRVFQHWQPTRKNARWIALALAATWLWLPLQVDTVLYTVQRMAQLAALFTLLALNCYMAARERIVAGQWGGQWLLWLGVPALTALAVLSKENGVLALPLALVLELFLFRDEDRGRPRSIRLFFALTVGLPALMAAAYLALHPGYVASGYAQRDFTLQQRLLTEPRVLWSYVQTLLVPLGPRMGFFQDNFPISAGMWHPWTTLPAIVAWIAAVAAAWAWRKDNPLFGAGVLFFLVGQSMESSALPLEIYFEHRNYLPSFGLLLSVVGLLAWGWSALPTPTRGFRLGSRALLGVTLAMYAAAAWSHVQSWRSYQTFFHAQEVFNPTSPRLQGNLISIAIDNHDLNSALMHIDVAERYAPRSLLPAVSLARIHAYCSAGQPPPKSTYERFAARAQGPISIATNQAMGLVTDDAIAKCPRLDDRQLVDVIGRWLDTAATAGTSQNAWETRYNLARIFIAHGALHAAREELSRAWADSRHNSTVGMLLFQVNGSLGDAAACRGLLAQLELQRGKGNRRLDEALVVFQKALADGEIQPASARMRNPRSGS